MRPLWWQTGVVYQIYPRSYGDANGDGIGDLEGIISHLDYLAETLPVDAIWLSPFYPSPQADFGYDISDYCDIDPMYGDLETFDRLVKECHARDIRVIVDYVPNHSSSLHPWFVESASNLTNPKRDWYTWRPSKANGSPPNNWVSVFGGPAWTVHPATGEYYLHSFLSEQPDLNWRNREVAEAMFDVLRFWMERGVDGFRIDVAHFIMKDPELSDNPPAKVAYHGHLMDAEYLSWEHVNDKGHADIHDAFRRLRAVVDEYPDRFTVGEIHEYEWPKWAAYYGTSNDELSMPFNFSLLPAGLDPEKLGAAVLGVEANLPAGAWPNWVWGNHDERRVRTRLGEAGSKVAALLQLTLRGTPFIYYGDELGMQQAQIPPEQQQDPRLPEFNRDGCRTPMRWDETNHVGFSPEWCADTWLPTDGDAVSVASQLGDPNGHLQLYRRLLVLRRGGLALQLGSIELREDLPPGCFGYLRSYEGARSIAVVANLGREAASVEVSGEILVATNPSLEGTHAGPLVLQPFEGVVVAAN